MLPQACLTLRVIIENPEEKKKKASGRAERWSRAIRGPKLGN